MRPWRRARRQLLSAAALVVGAVVGGALFSVCCPAGTHVTQDPKYCVGFLRICAPDVDPPADAGPVR